MLADVEHKHEMGFTRAIDVLIESKKPMVGHHMIFDLAYIFS